MTDKNGAYLSRVEWEALQNPWKVDDLTESPMLPPGSERVELRRDEQYRIEAKIFGTGDVSSNDPLPDLGETGTIIPNYRIEGSSHREGFSYGLDHCVVNRVSTEGTELEAELKTYRVCRKATRGLGPRAWLTEWYLNAHDRGVLFSRFVKRGLKETYRREREHPEEKTVFEGQQNETSSQYAFVETPDLAFAAELVPTEFGPSGCRGLAIEYKDEWGGVPEEGTRRSIANAVSFVMGRHLIGVGHTAFDERGYALEEVSLSPMQKDLVSLCRAASHPPVDLEEKRPSDRFEALMAELVPRYLELNGEFDFDNVLYGYWLFEELPLGANLPVLSTSVEMLKRAWYSSRRSKSKGVYMPKKDFDELLRAELAAAEEKLREFEYGNRMASRIRNAYNLGANESVEFFLEELGLPVGSVEQSAMKARNPMAHGSAVLLDESRRQEMIDNTLSYRTLFNRIMLKILGYDGTYIDYSAREWPERPLDEPLAGR